MKLEADSVNEFTPELLYRKRNRRAVNGRAVASDASAMRETDVVLRLSGCREGATPVRALVRYPRALMDLG